MSVSAPRDLAVGLINGNPVLSWKMPLDTPLIGGYEIYMSTTDSNYVLMAVVDGTVFEATHAFGTHGTKYYYKVISVGSVDESKSAPAKVNITCGADTTFKTISNPVQNGSFEGYKGWVVLDGEQIITGTELGTFYESTLGISNGLYMYQDIPIIKNHTYMLTAVGRVVDGGASGKDGAISLVNIRRKVILGSEVMLFNNTASVDRKIHVIQGSEAADTIRLVIEAK